LDRERSGCEAKCERVVALDVWVSEGVNDLDIRGSEGVDDLDVQDSEGVSGLAEDDRVRHEFNASMSKSSSPEPPSDSEPDITPE
jgi:hypothetical protein